MSIYQLWYELGLHWFNGVTSNTVIELFSVIMTSWTMIGFCTIPLCWMRGGRR